ncbi:amidohydrolase family protein [Kineococcus sp. SYSU DK006]|uniref:amidohydrolase family protein n=1 Tax=Kineococcus sp. SYSU DK006 TaxID=3383127 RepID=UPI003D7EE409
MPPAEPPAEPPSPAAGRAAGPVDAHHHLWDPADPGQDWLRAPGHEVLRRRFGPPELRAAAAGGVDGQRLGAAVVVQSVARLDETRRLLATAADDDLLAGVVGWVDLTGDVVAQLDELRSGPGGQLLVGVRHLVQDEPDPDWSLREDVRRGLRAVAAEGLVFDLLVRAPQRAAATAAVRRVPGLRVVLDHAGKPDLRRGSAPRALAGWAAQVRELAAVEGSVCKLSGLVSEVGPAGWSAADLLPVWEVLLETFGPHRLAFGSDWPVCLLTTDWRGWADAVTGLAGALTASEREALFGGTARAAYALPAGTPETPGTPRTLETA